MPSWAPSPPARAVVNLAPHCPRRIAGTTRGFPSLHPVVTPHVSPDEYRVDGCNVCERPRRASAHWPNGMILLRERPIRRQERTTRGPTSRFCCRWIPFRVDRLPNFSAVDLFRDGRRARGELRRCDHGLTERTVSGGERLVTQRLRLVTQRLRPVTQRLRPVTRRIGPVVRRLAPAARSIVRRSMGGDFRSDEDDSSGAATESRGKRMDLSLGEPRFDVTSRNGHAVPATGHPRKSSLSRMVGSTS